MDEQTKREERPQGGQSEGEPLGFKVTDEEVEIALRKLLAGWDW